ncbi:MAG: RDD family protein [Planctomycetes bacterium]|nr:RDD family protein [Planctomycetota bacterium]
MTALRLPFLLLCILFAAALSTAAPASIDEIAAGSPADGPGGGHAWLVRREPAGGSLIWHLPPRTSGVSQGRARIAADAHSMPVAAAAVGQRLYLIFDDKPIAPPAKPRQVLSVSAVPLDASGRWATQSSGEFDISPALRPDGVVLAATGSAGAPWVLLHALREEGANPKRLTLLRLDGDAWREIAISEEIQKIASSATVITGSKITMPLNWRLFASPKGVGLLKSDPAAVAPTHALAAWTLSLTDEPGNPRWSALELPADIKPGPGPDALGVCAAAGQLILSLADSAKADLWAIPLAGSSHPSRLLTSITGVAPPFSLAPLDADGIAALFFTQKEPAAEKQQLESSTRMIAEVSARTGRTLYNGPIIGVAPVGPADYSVLVVILFSAVASVVLFVARPPAAGIETHLPPRYCLAGPARRSIATAIDASVALVIGAVVWGVPAPMVLALDWWSTPESWNVAATALLIVVVGCSILETVVGTTVGKIVVGCGVASVKVASEAPLNPTIGQSFIRNLLKWCVPLVAFMGVIDPTRRHRADEWSRTAVICPIIEEETDLGE